MSERVRIRERTLSCATIRKNPTENAVFWPSPIAQQESGVQHKDICTIHKRAFVEGMAQVIEAFVPGVQVHYTNASSRTLDPQADCIEAFHVVFPW
jgi:hypothetical protein